MSGIKSSFTPFTAYSKLNVSSNSLELPARSSSFITIGDMSLISKVAVPYRKWSSPLDLKEIGMDDLSLHEKCALQLGWELAGKDDSRDRADMSVEELIDFGETEAEERELEVWLHGYMDPYEGEIDTAKYSMAEIVSKLFSN